MHPFLLITVAIGVGASFNNLFKDYPELGEISHKDINEDFLIDTDKSELTITNEFNSMLKRWKKDTDAPKVGTSMSKL